jgi:uncharacterized OB-fold protein
MGAKQRVPVVPGWFTQDAEPHLIGLRDPASGSFFFPKDVAISRAPGFEDAALEEVPLSRTGTLWSWTTNHYPPPPPYEAGDPFVPYTVVAVELARERMVVLGQLAPGVEASSLELGREMQLVVDTLSEDEENEYLVWKWKPVAA